MGRGSSAGAPRPPGASGVMQGVEGWVDEAQQRRGAGCHDIQAHSKALIGQHVLASPPQRRALQHACMGIHMFLEGLDNEGQEHEIGMPVVVSQAKVKQLLISTSLLLPPQAPPPPSLALQRCALEHACTGD